MLASLLLALLADVPSASAYEDQATVSLGLGYAHAVAEIGPGSGASAALTGSYGLDDIWAARARLSYAFHPADEALHVAGAALELLYLIDVLEIVPYLGVGGDGLLMLGAGAPEQRAHVGVHGVLGLDYLWSRELIFGVEVRGIAVLSAVDTFPAYVAAEASLTWVFDLF